MSQIRQNLSYLKNWYNGWKLGAGQVNAPQQCVIHYKVMHEFKMY